MCLLQWLPLCSKSYHIWCTTRVKFRPPAIYNLYNNLPNVSSKLYFILFADDTNVFDSHSSLETLFQIVNNELSLAANWFCANKLTLNLDKTNYILFRSHRKQCPSQYPILSINGSPLSRVESTKFLGVYVDQHLTWQDHIKCISSKIAKNIGIIARTAYLLPPSVRIKLYYSLVYPYLAYCNLIWASTYTTRLNRLIILQKRVIRIVAGTAYGSHTAPLFYKLNIPYIIKFEQIKLYQSGEFMYRYDHNLLPSVYKVFFSLASEIHSHSTRNLSNYRCIFARTNSRLFSIRVTGPSIWNKIPQGIRQSPSLVLFKKNYALIWLLILIMYLYESKCLHLILPPTRMFSNDLFDFHNLVKIFYLLNLVKILSSNRKYYCQ